jgi:hypothetical protein
MGFGREELRRGDGILGISGMHASRWAVLYLSVLVLAAGLLSFAARAGTARSGFDHLTTGFELIGQHRDAQRLRLMSWHWHDGSRNVQAPQSYRIDGSLHGLSYADRLEASGHL